LNGRDRIQPCGLHANEATKLVAGDLLGHAVTVAALRVAGDKRAAIFRPQHSAKVDRVLGGDEDRCHAVFKRQNLDSYISIV